MKRTLIAVYLLCAALMSNAAQDPEQGDIRDLRLGMHIGDLDRSNYQAFACGRDGLKPERELADPEQFLNCSSEPSGLYELNLQYNDAKVAWAKVNDKWEGTKIAGHPVLLSALLDEQGIVQGLRVITDPQARRYLKKKAFLFGIRVKGRYGEDGWQCQRQQPDADKSRIGGMFIDERCEKIYNQRRLILQTHLYRTAQQQGTEFTGRTRFEILSLR